MKIVLINLFIGSPPFYYKYFLETAKKNKEVDFLLISDNIPEHTDGNIIYKYLTLEGFSTLISEKLEIQFKFDSLNKLCDFKPTFGLLFEDYIKGYDYWGHIDIDIILGNILSTIGEQFKKGYDIITTRGDKWISGAFTCYKNSNYTNSLFKLSPTYRQVLGNKKQLLFDESGYRWDGVLHPFEYLIGKGLTISMFDIIGCEETKGKLNVHRKNLLCEYNRSNGYRFRLDSYGNHLFEDGQEKLLFHLIFVKNDPFFLWPKHLGNTFELVNEGIFNETQTGIIRHISYWMNFLKEYPSFFVSKVFRKFRSLINRK